MTPEGGRVSDQREFHFRVELRFNLHNGPGLKWLTNKHVILTSTVQFVLHRVAPDPAVLGSLGSQLPPAIANPLWEALSRGSYLAGALTCHTLGIHSRRVYDSAPPPGAHIIEFD